MQFANALDCTPLLSFSVLLFSLFVYIYLYTHTYIYVCVYIYIYKASLFVCLVPNLCAKLRPSSVWTQRQTRECVYVCLYKRAELRTTTLFLQDVCVLPSICTYRQPAPLIVGIPVNASTTSAPPVPSRDPFSCTMCEKIGDSFCSGLQCVAGTGSPPWSEDRCTKYEGSRCERCTKCRADVLDFEGRLVIRGQYRNGGCTGLQDTVCLDCSVCAAGEYEASPCTPEK
jgi:hypothetical protein